MQRAEFEDVLSLLPKIFTIDYCRIKLNLSHVVETQNVASLHWKKAGTSLPEELPSAATL